MRICLQSFNATCEYWQVCNANATTDSDAAAPSGTLEEVMPNGDPALLKECTHQDFSCATCSTVYCGCCYSLHFSKLMPIDTASGLPRCIACKMALERDFGWRTRDWCLCGAEHYISPLDRRWQTGSWRCANCADWSSEEFCSLDALQSSDSDSSLFSSGEESPTDCSQSP